MSWSLSGVDGSKERRSARRRESERRWWWSVDAAPRRGPGSFWPGLFRHHTLERHRSWHDETQRERGDEDVVEVAPDLDPEVRHTTAAAELSGQRLPQGGLAELDQAPEAEDGPAAHLELIALGGLARGRGQGDGYAEGGGVESLGAAGQQEDQEQRGQRPARQLHKPGTAKV